jgi:hypothetical protein
MGNRMAPAVTDQDVLVMNTTLLHRLRNIALAVASVATLLLPALTPGAIWVPALVLVAVAIAAGSSDAPMRPRNRVP